MNTPTAVSLNMRRYSRDLAEADVAVLGIPFDLATAIALALALARVRYARRQPVWRGKVRAVGWGFSPLEELAVVDYGDCDFDAGNPAGVPEEIYQCAKQILATDTALLSIGGDHFVSYPLLRAHAERHGQLSH